MDRPIPEHTFYGLISWKEAMFHKAGMVMVAYEEGDSEKLVSFLEKLEKLATALDNKLDETIDDDRRNDLRIMGNKVELLRRALTKSINHPKRSLSDRRTRL